MASRMGMQIGVGFEMESQCCGVTPMVLALGIHCSRDSDLVRPDLLVAHPALRACALRDLSGSWGSRLVAPPVRFVLGTDAPVLLLCSRYCETELRSDIARKTFCDGPSGWALR